MLAERRRKEILEYLNVKRYTTAKELSEKFNVRKCTIYRDIDVLSSEYPIYTDVGPRGGIYVMKGYKLNMIYLNDEQVNALEEIIQEEVYVKLRETLVGILEKFRKPEIGEEKE